MFATVCQASLLPDREPSAHREIQSVSVSCFVHATEDEEKVKTAVLALLGSDTPPDEERLEGHYGNTIVRLTWRLLGDDAWTAFQGLARVIDRLGSTERIGLQDCIDEHGALFLRFNKQSIVRGSPVLSSSDPVRVKVKPRGFMKSDPIEFYGRLVESAAR